jgi:integrase
MYKESDPRTGFLEDAAYVRLARECSKEGLWLRALLTVAYSFGFRSGELLPMRVRQIDLLSRTIRLEVGSTKNDEGRITPMTDEVFKLLTACVSGKQPDDYVFTRPRKGKPAGVRVCSFRKRWKKVCLQAGVPDLIFHDLRRSGVRNLRRLGVQESVVMKISGHKTRSVFERYNIIDEADLTEAARKLNEKQNSLGQSSGIVAPEMVKPATAPSLAPLPN